MESLIYKDFMKLSLIKYFVLILLIFGMFTSNDQTNS